jgi:hypothetical protein
LAFVRDGDSVVVHSMDRLARNLEDLRRLVRELTSRGVHVEFVKERLVFSGEDAPMATLLLSVLGVFAGFERALIRERQLEGIALAKAAAPIPAANPPSPPTRPSSCGSGPRPRNPRPPWPASSASADEPSTSTCHCHHRHRRRPPAFPTSVRTAIFELHRRRPGRS